MPLSRVRFCPRCSVAVLGVRTDIESYRGYLLCSTCGYAETEESDASDDETEG